MLNEQQLNFIYIVLTFLKKVGKFLYFSENFFVFILYFFAIFFTWSIFWEIFLMEKQFSQLYDRLSHKYTNEIRKETAFWQPLNTPFYSKNLSTILFLPLFRSEFNAIKPHASNSWTQASAKLRLEPILKFKMPSPPPEATIQAVWSSPYSFQPSFE